MLKAQSSFLTSLRFNTPWAQQLFPQELVDAKTAEAEHLRRLLLGRHGITRITRLKLEYAASLAIIAEWPFSALSRSARLAARTSALR
jgi:hypothetical protein